MEMLPLRKRIDDEMKTAMRNKESQRLGTIRLLISAIKQKEIDERITLDESQIFAVIDKMIKQRLDSIKHYETGERPDLIEIEKAEIEILKQYLPLPLSENEIDSLIKNAIKEVSPTSIKELGKVISHIKPQIQGRADIGKVSAKIKAILEA